jgi:flagellar hook-associated protein 2
MANSSIDGLISGLSTSDLISKLMQVESAGQTRLKTQVTTQQKAITSLQSVNTKIAALKTAASAMTTASTWSAAKATSSSDAITVTAGSQATTGKLILDVTELAQIGVKTAKVTDGASLVGASGLNITVGGVSTDIPVTADTPEGVVAGINQANVGVRASLVKSDQGTILQLTGTKTGAANDFEISGLSEPLTVTQTAKDGIVTVGDPANGGYTITSATNTFSNVAQGLTVTASRKETGITVSVNSDADSMATKMQAMVDAANSLMTELKTQSAITVDSSSGSKSTTNAPLSGNFAIRQLQQSVLSSVTTGASGYGSYSQLGLQTDRDGKLVFDKAKFLSAYQADPTKVQSAVTNGIGKTLGDLSSKATTDVTNLIQSGNTRIRTLNDQIDSWDVRLQVRQDSLQKQFTNLETALGKMKDQSSWLASQISSLG